MKHLLRLRPPGPGLNRSNLRNLRIGSPFGCGSVALCPTGEVRFEIGAYDRALPLVIDPVLVYSTYLGGSDYDEASGIAVDGSGNAYVTGTTSSTNFPTVNPILGDRPAGDAFVAKLDATGATLVYCTYLGGNGGDVGSRIAVDGAGAAYVAGFTTSTDFPTAGPIQNSFQGVDDVFVAKMNATGSALSYSTYLGGSGSDEPLGLAVDGAGSAYVTGLTTSLNFPLLGARQAAYGGGAADAFVSKLTANGAALAYSTYHGGNGFDQSRGIAVDASGNAYVVGFTDSTNGWVSRSGQLSPGSRTVLSTTNDREIAETRNPHGMMVRVRLS